MYKKFLVVLAFIFLSASVLAAETFNDTDNAIDTLETVETVEETAAASEKEETRSNNFFDRLKFEGLLRLQYSREKANSWAWLITPDDGSPAYSFHDFKRETINKKTGLLRLDMTAEVNSMWDVKARIEGTYDFSESESDIKLMRAYAEGRPWNCVNIKLGAIGGIDAENLTNRGFVIDQNQIFGGSIVAGNQVKAKITVGRIDEDKLVMSHGAESVSAFNVVYDKWMHSDYQGFELFGNVGKFDWAIGYHIVKNEMFEKAFHTNKENIIAGGIDYHFNDDFTLGLFYSHGDFTVPNDDYFGSKNEKKGYSIQLSYKKADREVQGSFGAWLAYRHIGAFSTMYPTFDGVQIGSKGFEVGFDYVIAPRVLLKVVGAWGKSLNSGPINQARVADEWVGGYAPERDTSHLTTRIEYYF